MIDARIKLTVKTEISSAFVDVSNEAVDYLRDTFSPVMVADTDFIYVGFSKPINAVYMDFATVGATESAVVVQAHNGTTWAAVTSQDETEGFSRNGFITWDRTDMTETTVDSDEMYWVRFKLDDANSPVINGLNLVFSDDEMMRREFPNINDPRIIPSGQTSHIIHHVASRNLIVQTLRNEGYIKCDSDGNIENITQWDLLDIYEIREAATYMALSKIFFLLSDDVEDNWWSKHKQYAKLFDKTFARAKLSVDKDDDGATDLSENLDVRRSARFTR